MFILARSTVEDIYFCVASITELTYSATGNTHVSLNWGTGNTHVSRNWGTGNTHVS
jgi:hypothetical protein